MQENRGLRFLVGLAGLYVLWSLRNSGFFEQLYSWLFPAKSASGAVVFTLLSDLIVAFGGVIILVASGLWELIAQALSGLGGFAGEARKSVEAFQQSLEAKRADSPPPQPGTPEPAAPVAIGIQDQLSILAAAVQELRSDVAELQAVDPPTLEEIGLSPETIANLIKAGLTDLPAVDARFLEKLTFADIPGITAAANNEIIAALTLEKTRA
jgi:hypothetical protein